MISKFLHSVEMQDKAIGAEFEWRTMVQIKAGSVLNSAALDKSAPAVVRPEHRRSLEMPIDKSVCEQVQSRIATQSTHSV